MCSSKREEKDVSEHIGQQVLIFSEATTYEAMLQLSEELLWKILKRWVGG